MTIGVDGHNTGTSDNDDAGAIVGASEYGDGNEVDNGKDDVNSKIWKKIMNRNYSNRLSINSWMKKWKKKWLFQQILILCVFGIYV